MKFHDHPLVHRETIVGRGLSGLPHDEQLRGITRILNEHDRDAATNIGIQMETEIEWLEDGSPFYDVFPTVVEPFLRVRLENLRVRDIHLPLPRLLLRFAVGHEPLGKIKTIMCSQYRLPKPTYRVLPALANPTPVGAVIHVSINDGDVERFLYEMHAHTIANLVCNDALLETELDIKPEDQFTPHKLDKEMILAAYRLVVAVSLVGQDPDVVEPLCLTADAQRYDQGDDELRRRLLERARRRNKIGWAVGKHMQVVPGVVQPHFGIRWCGHRPNLEPRLRPISGWVIKRRVLEQVPSGFLNREGDV